MRLAGSSPPRVQGPRLGASEFIPGLDASHSVRPHQFMRVLVGAWRVAVGGMVVLSFPVKQQYNFLGSECISVLTPSRLASDQISNLIQVWSWLEQGERAGEGPL